MLVATKPGQPPLKMEKRLLDSKVFEVDCSPLLSSKDEMLFGKPRVSIGGELGTFNISNARCREGSKLTFLAEGGPTGLPYIDYNISFIMNTTKGSSISLPIIIRVYST